MGKTLPTTWRISKIKKDMSHELGSFESFEQQKHLVNRWLKAMHPFSTLMRFATLTAQLSTHKPLFSCI